jgi:F-type H+-transporting ATPase subunit b
MRKRTQEAILTALAALALAVPALAAPQGEGGHGEGEYNIFAGDVGNVFWTVTIFLLVIVVLRRFAWNPILENLKKREDFIRESLDQAKDHRESAVATLKEYEQKLVAARAEATAIVEEGRRDADVLRHKIEQEARAEAEKILARAKREIRIARETAVKDLYDLSGHLATGIAAHILGRELKVEDQERMIDEAIDKMSGLAAD